MKKLLALSWLVLLSCHSRDFTSEVKDLNITEKVSSGDDGVQLRHYRYWLNEAGGLVRGKCTQLPASRTNCPEVASIKFASFKTQIDSQFDVSAEENKLAAINMQLKGMSREKNTVEFDHLQVQKAGLQDLVAQGKTYQKMLKNLVAHPPGKEVFFEFDMATTSGQGAAYLFHRTFNKIYIDDRFTVLTLKNYFELSEYFTFEIVADFTALGNHTLSSSHVSSRSFCRANLLKPEAGQSYHTLTGQLFFQGPNPSLYKVKSFLLTDKQLSFTFETDAFVASANANLANGKRKSVTIAVNCKGVGRDKLMISDLKLLNDRKSPLLLKLAPEHTNRF